MIAINEMLLLLSLLSFASIEIISHASTAPRSMESTPIANSASGNSKKCLDNVRVPMRDGVTLSTNLFFPEGDSPFPVIFIRTPYDASNKKAEEWTAHGYAVVYQDTRGRFRSGGEDLPWTEEIADAEDALNWMTKQPWCDGNVGMYGGSYIGYTQIAAARTGHPALKVISPALIGAEQYHTAYWGGALRHRMSRWLLRGPADADQQSIEKHLPLSTLDMFLRERNMPYWHEVLAHPIYDDYWKKRSLREDLSKLQSPAFIRTGWFDLFIADAFDLYDNFRNKAGSEVARKHTRMIVGPWPHDINQTNFSDVDFGDKAKIPDLFEQEIEYMGNFLKKEGKEAPARAPIRIYVMGADQWRDEHEWPLARTEWTKFYFSGEGKANTASGNGRLSSKASGPADRFDYDPANPVPTHGGAWCFSNLGLRNQEEIEKRNDVLVYTSEPLKEATEVTGPVTAKLFISSSAPDTDFTVKLVDVAPDGKAFGITDGIVRARYRNQVPEGEFLKPGEVYPVTVQCPPTSYQFKAGHRIRVQISSSNFPVFARNLNTGGPIADETTPVIAKQTIHHTEEYPSHITLPIIPQAP